MYEKEAEDSFNCKKVLYKWETDKHSYIDGFKDGAEFGYKKARVEANEWHDLQDNPSDLPKNREKVLLLVKLNDKWNRTEVLIGYRDFGECLGEYCKDWGYFEPVKNRLYDFVDGEEVIAWKEIVPPKENE